MKPKRTPYSMHPEEADGVVDRNCSCVEATSGVTLPACGAKTRGGSPCRNLPMKNDRCRMHGGASTGRKTAVGIASHRAAVTIHDDRFREMMEFRRRLRELQADARRIIEIA